MPTRIQKIQDAILPIYFETDRIFFDDIDPKINKWQLLEKLHVQKSGSNAQAALPTDLEQLLIIEGKTKRTATALLSPVRIT